MRVRRHSLGAANTRRIPQELVTRLEKQFGLASRGIFEAFGQERVTSFRVNTLKTTDQDVMAMCREEGVIFERVKEIPHAFIVKNRDEQGMLASALCRKGFVYLQGLSSLVPPLVLSPTAGASVLDLCAAPGSKTSQMAAQMEDHGRLVALEKDAVRAAKLRKTLSLQGVTCAEVFEGDAALLCRAWPEEFDFVLADVPCSAEGRIRSAEPRSFSFWSQKNIVAHAKVQRRLLRAGVSCLKPGGRLVYSTCTLAPEENEMMAAWLLEEFPRLRAVPIRIPGLPFLPTKPAGAVLLPTQRQEGFFVACFEKMRADN